MKHNKSDNQCSILQILTNNCLYLNLLLLRQKCEHKVFGVCPGSGSRARLDDLVVFIDGLGDFRWGRAATAITSAIFAYQIGIVDLRASLEGLCWFDAAAASTLGCTHQEAFFVNDGVTECRVRVGVNTGLGTRRRCLFDQWHDFFADFVFLPQDADHSCLGAQDLIFPWYDSPIFRARFGVNLLLCSKLEKQVKWTFIGLESAAIELFVDLFFRLGVVLAFKFAI